jgi:hypothetical protein
MSRLILSLDQLFVGEALEAVALFAVVAVLRVVAGDEVVEVAALEGVFFEREVQVGEELVDPELRRPRRFVRGLAVEEEDVRLDSLRVEDAGRGVCRSLHLVFSNSSTLTS